MITIKKAEKISAIYKKVEALHKELIKLNKIANTILQTEGNCEIKLSTDKVKENVLDEDESLINSSSIYNVPDLIGVYWCTPKLKEDDSNKESVKLEIDDILTLEVLGVLISRKQTEIDKYLNQINKL